MNGQVMSRMDSGLVEGSMVISVAMGGFLEASTAALQKKLEG